MKKLSSLLLIISIIFTALPGATHAQANNTIQVHVSANGSTFGSGTKSNPFNSIESAKQAVERLKRVYPKCPIEVIFHGGTYRFLNTVYFTKSDSGVSVDTPITYKAAEGEKVYFKGSKQIDISTIKPVENVSVLSRLPSTSRGKVGYIDLAAQGITDLGTIPVGLSMWRKDWQYEAAEIFVDDNRQTLSRWPNGTDGYSQYQSVVSTGGKGEGGALGGTFAISDFRLKRWETAPDAWVAGFFSYDWLYERIKIANINTAKKEVKLANSAIYGISTAYSHRYAVINLLEELDMPGEYYIDRSAKILYYYPERALANSTMEISMLTDGILNLTEVSNVNFENITFSETRGCGIKLNEKMENMTISGCTFENIGRYGIWQECKTYSQVASQTTQKSQYEENGNINFHLIGNVFRSCGSRGCTIICGSRDANIPSGCSVKNNYVYDIGSADKRSYGIYVSGVGVEIANNTVHQVAYAIYFLGSDIDIHHNETYDVMNNLTDGGAIYTGRNFINRGNKVHHNYIHDIRPKNTMITAELTQGVYLDDMDCGTEVYQNIIVGADEGILINCGMSNNIHDNIVVDCTNRAVRISTFNVGLKTSYDRMYLQGVAALKLEGYSRFPDIKADIDSGLLTYPARNTVQNNVTTASVEYSDMILGYNTIGNNYVVTEDEFVDSANGDYRIKSSSVYAKSTSVLTDKFDMSSVGADFNALPVNPLLDNGFKLIYPKNGLTEITTEDITFTWQRAIGADRYRLVVATDSALQDVVYDVTTYETTHTLSGFENGKAYYWRVFAKNESVNQAPAYASLGANYMFTVSKQFAHDTLNLEAAVISAKAKLEEIVEGDSVGTYKIGTKQALADKIRIAEDMLNNGVDSVDDENAIISDIENIMNNDIFINGGYIDLGDFLANADSWVCNLPQQMKVDPVNKTLNAQNNGSYVIMGYKGIENVSRVLALSFKMKVDFGTASASSWIAMGLRGASPTDALWVSGNDQYYMVMKQGSLEYQRNSGGNTKILETVVDESIKNNEWMDIDFGIVNLGNVGQLTILKINGKIAYQNVDYSDEMVLKKGTFQIMLSNGTAIELRESGRPTENFDELVSEYSLSMTTDLCKQIEGYNSAGGMLLRSGSHKAYYGGVLYDIDTPLQGEGEAMTIDASLVADIFGGTLSDSGIVIGDRVYPTNGLNTVNLKEFVDFIGKTIYFHNDTKLVFIADSIDMHTANYGRLFDAMSKALNLYN